jgi:hypothetical protein
MDWKKATSKLCGRETAPTVNDDHVRLGKELADKIDGTLIAGIQQPDGTTRVVLGDSRQVDKPTNKDDAAKYHRARIVTLKPEDKDLSGVDISGMAFSHIIEACRYAVSQGWVKKGQKDHLALYAAGMAWDARAAAQFFPLLKDAEAFLPMIDDKARKGMDPALAGQIASLCLVSGQTDEMAKILSTVKGAELYLPGVDALVKALTEEWRKASDAARQLISTALDAT